MGKGVGLDENIGHIRQLNRADRPNRALRVALTSGPSPSALSLGIRSRSSRKPMSPAELSASKFLAV